MAKASLCGSWLSCVCKLANLFFNTLTPISTIFSGFSAPLDSTFIKNLFGLASQLNAASYCSSSNSVCSLFGHSSGFGNNVCRIELSGSYSKHTPAANKLTKQLKNCKLPKCRNGPTQHLINSLSIDGAPPLTYRLDSIWRAPFRNLSSHTPAISILVLCAI